MLQSLPLDELARAILPADHVRAQLVGRAWLPDIGSGRGGPAPILVRDGSVFDLSAVAPTMAHLLALKDIPARLLNADFPSLGALGLLARNSFAEIADPTAPSLLAPCDLQPVKACGVTYIASVLERLVEERSGGDPARIPAARAALELAAGGALSGVKPGSSEAAALKAELVQSGHWSHYLEVAIGPDAESFSKCPPMAAVGFGADVGVRSDSSWNNPEPELVLAIAPSGAIVGASLGNDVNLRDFEGRSPMLLDKAKDNNASAAIGPFIRLIDRHFTLDDVRQTHLRIAVESEGDDYRLEAEGDVSDITRDIEDLVSQVMGRHHQYPDGLMLFTGTMWVPNDDRLGEGKGFSHRDNDWVSISAPRLGRLANRTRRTEDCPPWRFGLSALIDHLVSTRIQL